MAHRSCFIQRGVPKPVLCYVFVQWICIEQITCYMLGYPGQKEIRSLPSRLCILLAGGGKSLHFTGGGGGERVSRNKYMMIL